MTNCETCKYATWDYCEYYGTNQKQWFVDGCKKNLIPDECEEEDDGNEIYFRGGR